MKILEGKALKKIGNAWDEIIGDEFNKPYYGNLAEKVDAEYKTAHVYPPQEFVFRALNAVDYADVKVVILGQDPYHGEGQANGMAFAVNEGVSLPPSLVNIYHEIESELNIAMPNEGMLTGWAKQGVLLLNTTLTVLKGRPRSHAGLGWQVFTDAVIQACSNRPSPMVFLLWGSNAIAKKELIAPRHLVLTAPHPSPLSAYRGFFGCGHFVKTNEFLSKNGLTPIDWADVSGRPLAPYYANTKKIHRI